MIGKEDFVKVINWHVEQEERINRLSDIFSSAFDSDIINSPYIAIDILLNNIFTEDGVGWIEWWLYESYSFSTKTYDRTYEDENGKTVKVETVDDLWELVKNNRK